MTDCVVCQRRPPATPLVCDGCRQRLDVDLGEIVDLYALLPAVMEPGPSTGQRVSGSREAPLPLRVDALDLARPLHPGPLSPPPRGRADALDLALPLHRGTVHDPERLQAGHLPVVAVLDSWVRDWIEVRAQREHQPVPTVVTLIGWLRDRLTWACDHHTAVDDFAAEMRHTVGALRSVLGRTELRHRLPAPCPDCDMLTLYRDDGADWVECGSCHRLWSEAEYAFLVRIMAEEVA